MGLRVAEVVHTKWEDLEYDDVYERYYLTFDTKGDNERIDTFRILRRLPIDGGSTTCPSS